MRCIHCNTTFYENVELNEWDACPICGKRMLGFRDEDTDIAVDELAHDIIVFGKKLRLLSERMRQMKEDQE